MLKSLRIIFGVIVVVLAIYGLITDKASVTMVYIQFFLAAMFLVMGLAELQVKRKETAFLMFLASAGSFFAFIFTLV